MKVEHKPHALTRRDLLCLLTAGVPAAFANTLPALDRLIAPVDANYLVLDVRSREVLAERWPGAATPIPVGSTVKPFTALAYAGAFPNFRCEGAANSCWSTKPHGTLGFVDALAQSCNAYFLQLAARVDPGSLRAIASTFQIPAPSTNTPEARIGLGDSWRIAPQSLINAYAELASRRGDPRVDQILAGLERAASHGTARGISKPGDRLLAKTGTAPCVAPRKHKGDGFALVLYPAEAPRTALLVQVHGVPGAEASKTAAKIVRVLREGV